MIFILGGVLASGIPSLGVVLSFAAPVLALVGIITGGVEVSRRGRTGQGAGLATTGLIVSAVAFLPALTVALTCGVCSAMCAGVNHGAGPTAGPRGMAFFDAGISPPAARPATPPKPDPVDDVNLNGPSAAPVPGAPPPAFPPPPIEPAAEPVDNPEP